MSYSSIRSSIENRKIVVIFEFKKKTINGTIFYIFVETSTYGDLGRDGTAYWFSNCNPAAFGGDNDRNPQSSAGGDTTVAVTPSVYMQMLINNWFWLFSGSHRNWRDWNDKRRDASRRYPNPIYLIWFERTRMLLKSTHWT